MLEKINNIWTNYINGIEAAATKAASDALGNVLVGLGTHIEEIAIIIIVIGALLWICKITKIFRYGCISYLVGLLIELIGSLMIK